MLRLLPATVSVFPVRLSYLFFKCFHFFNLFRSIIFYIFAEYVPHFVTGVEDVMISQGVWGTHRLQCSSFLCIGNTSSPLFQLFEIHNTGLLTSHSTLLRNVGAYLFYQTVCLYLLTNPSLSPFTTHTPIPRSDISHSILQLQDIRIFQLPHMNEKHMASFFLFLTYFT